MFEIQNALKTMTGIFPEPGCRIGEERSRFRSCSESIVEQMERPGIHQDYCMSVLLSMLIREARKVCRSRESQPEARSFPSWYCLMYGFNFCHRGNTRPTFTTDVR